MAAAQTECVSCGGSARALGPLPDANFFAGRSLATVLPGGALYRCEACALGFRHPRPDKSVLDRLYRGGAPESWESESGTVPRMDWAIARRVIAQRGPRASILDVGCFDGGFLHSLQPTVTKVGIEIMPSAARSAEKKGVRLLGGDFECIADEPGRHDVVTTFDVIEHVGDPLAFLRLLAGAVKPGGALVVSTGNLDAWSWRLMRNRYWYCALPEHISFASDRWFRHAACALGLNVVALHRFRHSPQTMVRRAREIASNMAFLAAPGLVGALRAAGVGGMSARLHPAVRTRYPPGWISACDHVMAVLQR